MGDQLNAGPNPHDVFGATPEVRGGVASFTGTRVGVSQILGYLRDGYTIDDFPRDFPTVTKDQAQLAIERTDNEWINGIERECGQEHDPGPDKAAGGVTVRAGGRTLAVKVGEAARSEGAGRTRSTNERFTVAPQPDEEAIEEKEHADEQREQGHWEGQRPQPATTDTGHERSHQKDGWVGQVNRSTVERARRLGNRRVGRKSRRM